MPPADFALSPFLRERLKLERRVSAAVESLAALSGAEGSAASVLEGLLRFIALFSKFFLDIQVSFPLVQDAAAFKLV